MSWWQLEEKSLNILKTIQNMTKYEKKETSNNCIKGINNTTYKCKHYFLDKNMYIMILYLSFSLWIYV